MPQFDVSRILRETFVRQVDYLPVVDSTNTCAAEWAKSGKANLPLLVLADHQTAGRGRGTNRWWTDDGSLAFSLLIDETWMPASSSQLPMLGLAAGVAAIETIQLFLPEHRVALLWPNDISVADRKLGGILVEVNGRRYAVIGIGVNVNNSVKDAPVDLQTSAVSMLDLTKKPADISNLLIRMLCRMERELRHLCQTELTSSQPPYCLPQNVPIKVRCEEGILSGICRGIESDELIVLETESGVKSVYPWTVAPAETA
jgi:BirA family biotin operon repressor/biotin-[acetyl-CoA-carboxylase] ligase